MLFVDMHHCVRPPISKYPPRRMQSARRSRPNFPRDILLDDDVHDAEQGSPPSADLDPDDPSVPPHYPSAAHMHPHHAQSSPTSPMAYSAYPTSPGSYSDASSYYSSPTHYPVAVGAAGAPHYRTILPQVQMQNPIPQLSRPPSLSADQGSLANGSILQNQWVCDKCGYSFTRAHDLRRHTRSKHEEEKSECICGKAFSRRDALLRHQRPDNMTGYGGCDIHMRNDIESKRR